MAESLSVKMNGDNISQMTISLDIKVPGRFSFKHTVQSHGWYDLPPFEHRKGANKLAYVFRPSDEDQAISMLIAAKPEKLNVTLSEPPKDTGRILNGVRHILRLDDD